MLCTKIQGTRDDKKAQWHWISKTLIESGPNIIDLLQNIHHIDASVSRLSFEDIKCLTTCLSEDGMQYVINTPTLIEELIQSGISLSSSTNQMSEKKHSLESVYYRNHDAANVLLKYAPEVNTFVNYTAPGHLNLTLDEEQSKAREIDKDTRRTLLLNLAKHPNGHTLLDIFLEQIRHDGEVPSLLELEDIVKANKPDETNVNANPFNKMGVVQAKYT